MSVDADVEGRELNERQALRIVGNCFLLLAAYVGYESGADLILKRAPDHSLPGIVLSCVSLILMPALSRAKQIFWWADPAAALLMVLLIAKEGTEALRGEKCIDCHTAHG